MLNEQKPGVRLFLELQKQWQNNGGDKMNKTLLFLILVILITILGCLIASQMTLEKIDEDLHHYDEVLQEVEGDLQGT